MAEETSNKARGYKAAISNPNVSDEAKQHAKEVLDNELQGGNVEVSDEGGKDPGNVERGLKAAINNPNVTEEGKKTAQEKLDAL
ncbi:hypothetical protein B7463_g8035, partial [Scytalidium lignicola]